jgi:cadmium resistance protein CadD (predicted permease)
MFLFIFMNVYEDKKQENQVWLAHILWAMPTVAATIIGTFVFIYINTVELGTAVKS